MKGYEMEELKRNGNVYEECHILDAINTVSVCENMTRIQNELQKRMSDKTE